MRDSAIEKIEVKLTQSKKKKKKIRLKTGSLEDAAAMSCPAKVNHLCAIVKHVRRQSRVFFFFFFFFLLSNRRTQW